MARRSIAMAGTLSALASGLRSVAVAGDVTNSVIVTGDHANVQVRVDGADALLAKLLTEAELPRTKRVRLPQIPVLNVRALRR